MDLNKLTTTCFVFLILFLSLSTLQAQVTIGTNKPPEKFSVLEVSTMSTKGGLRLPILTTQEKTDLAINSLPIRMRCLMLLV